ncbi:MAG: tRNA uridine-5-carboxymethylaminomethyl(34) synthesis GTPase MnmE [Deltaproteobacteria bacterium]|jgi:tRNA modification GTPase|nr:tRNA uridine-5-carboxymethylaminomethyl(34) synthesis GTPase MnmE [Deltaproteobacteria bacterium]
MIKTIYASITPPGYSSTAIVRVSGELCVTILQQLVEKADEVLANPRQLVYTKISHIELLDLALVVYFKSPQSFTGEDCLEFHLHGSPLIINNLLRCLKMLGCEPAQPGEFSQRAFLNGKLDLTQAESIADLISAETTAQAKVAFEQLQGKLKDALINLGEPLRELLAELEAFIDFPEEDIPQLSLTRWRKQVVEVQQKLAQYINSYQTGKLYKDGAKVVLVGRPNVGKSSLLNVLVGEERAIVTAIAGTTRDTIEEHISIRGLCVKIFDTAGLVTDLKRQIDEVEKLGIERSWQKIKQADLVLYLKDASLSQAELQNEEVLFAEVKKQASQVLSVATKIDLCSVPVSNVESEISAKQQLGIKELRETIYNKLMAGKPQTTVYITTQRHFDALCAAQVNLNSALNLLDKATAVEACNSQAKITNLAFTFAPEVLAIELRTALKMLEDIIGITSNEDLLARIFSKFCIGK